VVSVAPAFHHHDFRCNNLWFRSIAQWKRSLTQQSAGTAAASSSTDDGASVVFNASKASLCRQLAADGVLHAGWANGLPVSFLAGVFACLHTRDLFQVAYMCVRATMVVSDCSSAVAV
jgi:hypothetical protein